jgi:putative FmdB family regulatory protein
MPTYEYEAVNLETGCARCRQPFDCVQRMADPPLAVCPACGKPVRKIISCPSIGASTSSFDSRAKNKGFHKLQRLGKGEYEMKY